MLSIRPRTRLTIPYGMCIRSMCTYASVVNLAVGGSVTNKATLSSFCCCIFISLYLFILSSISCVLLKYILSYEEVNFVSYFPGKCLIFLIDFCQKIIGNSALFVMLV